MRSNSPRIPSKRAPTFDRRRVGSDLSTSVDFRHVKGSSFTWITSRFLRGILSTRMALDLCSLSSALATVNLCNPVDLAMSVLASTTGAPCDAYNRHASTIAADAPCSLTIGSVTVIDAPCVDYVHPFG